MMNQSRVLICTSVFNEGTKAISQIHKFPHHLPCPVEWFIIDDGSTDDTVPLLKRETAKLPFPVTIVSNDRNRGIGYSLKRGITYAFANGFDIVMNVTGNGKDDFAHIPVILKPILDGTHDYVTGSRFMKGGSFKNLPTPRKYMIKGYTLIFNILTWSRLTDATNGFRAYTTKFLQDPRINLNQAWLDRYELEYYLYYKALTLGYRVCEVPVSKDYPVRGKKKVSYSKIRPIVDWWKIIRPLVYLRLGIKK